MNIRVEYRRPSLYLSSTCDSLGILTESANAHTPMAATMVSVREAFATATIYHLMLLSFQLFTSSCSSRHSLLLLTVDRGGGVDRVVRAGGRDEANSSLNAVVRVVSRAAGHQVGHSRPDRGTYKPE